MSTRRSDIDLIASAVASRLARRQASGFRAAASRRAVRAASLRAASLRAASARAASLRAASARSASARAQATSASAIAGRVASIITRRLGGAQASRAPLQLVASGAARRFASGRTNDLVASIVARRLASAVSRRLADEGSPLIKLLASAVASRLTRVPGKSELPVQGDT